jgi:hypothetical protein
MGGKSVTSTYETFGFDVEFQRDGNHGGTVCGNPQTVGLWLIDYMRRYAPAGYGTQVMSDKTEGDVRTVRVFRGSSCD